MQEYTNKISIPTCRLAVTLGIQQWIKQTLGLRVFHPDHLPESDSSTLSTLNVMCKNHTS